eukprot:15465582-Alexandrium_andersonii.AAC.1
MSERKRSRGATLELRLAAPPLPLEGISIYLSFSFRPGWRGPRSELRSAAPALARGGRAARSLRAEGAACAPRARGTPASTRA